jgi:CheY-like chemotaxis protein
MSRSLRLLVVEDHIDSAELLAQLLALAGHVVRVESTVAGAIAAAREQVFDVVLSDLRLPDASGYELMAELRDAHALKGIAMTGLADVQKCQAAGFSVALTKPITMQRLTKALDSIVSPAS